MIIKIFRTRDIRTIDSLTLMIVFKLFQKLPDNPSQLSYCLILSTRKDTSLDPEQTNNYSWRCYVDIECTSEE